MRAGPTPPWFRREGETTPCKLSNSLLFLDLFSLSLFLFRWREGETTPYGGKEERIWWEIMWEDVGCAQEKLLALEPRGVTTEEAKQLGAVKRHSKH
jgi:hypothetical protein